MHARSCPVAAISLSLRLGLTLAVACKSGSKTSTIPTASAASAAPSVTSNAFTSAGPADPASAVASAPHARTSPLPWADAGAGCRLVRGPIELPLRAPAALIVRSGNLEVILNDDGKPRTASFPIVPVLPLGALRPDPESANGPIGQGYGVPCAPAGDWVFCVDRNGAVHRALPDGSDDRVVGSSRVGSRIAAARLAETHTALGYLASRQTSEGWVSEAWAVVDDGAPMRLSEDGSGATALAFAPRGGSVLALTIDARSALTAMHARPVTFEGGAPRFGEDVVAFVGGPGDRRTRGALVVPDRSGPAWGLLPIAKDVGNFGLALVRLDEPPRVDEPVSWSMYENGLDPAPVAAAAAQGRSWAARVVPHDASPGASRVLELGEISPSGTFSVRQVIPTTGKPTDIALIGDPSSALWLSWVDATGSWVERLICSVGPSVPLPGH